MTLEYFKNLKIGDEIKFDNGDVYTLTSHKRNDEFRHYEPNEVIYPDGHYFTFGENLMLISFKNNSDYITITKNGINSIIPYFSFLTNIIHIENHNSEKEQIEQQIKQLQDKLKKIEKNDDENVEKAVKTLVPGDFIEIIYKDPDTKSDIYQFLEITKSKNSIIIYSYGTRTGWQITIRSISKIIIRKDIKEAYEKFSATLNLKSTH